MNASDWKNILATSGPGLALDIDDTLAATMKYWIDELTRLFGNPENITAESIETSYIYCERVPAWQHPEALSWMQERIACHDTQLQFECISGAQNCVAEIHKRQPIKAYITVRPESVADASRLWLREHGFPEAPIIARPDEVKHQHGPEWKANLIHELYPSLVGIVDNDRHLANALPQDYAGTVYLLSRQKSHRTDVNVVHGDTWEEIHRQIILSF